MPDTSGLVPNWKKLKYFIKSSSCYTVSTDISDPLSPPLPIVHCFWQVFWATSSICTELLYVCLSWMSRLCSSLRRGPQEYITYELVPTSLAVSRMSGLSNFDSFVSVHMVHPYNSIHTALHFIGQVWLPYDR